MTLLRLLEYLNDALFVGLAGICYVQWRRRGGRAAGWLAATFGTLGAAVLVGLALSADPTAAAAQWVAKSLLAVLVLFPYLLFRFTACLDRAARRTEVVVGVLAATTVAWTLLIPRFPAEGAPRPGWLGIYLVALLVEWTVVSIVASGKLWWAGRGQPTAARRRTRALSLAAMGLSLTLVVSGLAPSSRPVALEAAVRVFTLASALLFYLAFAPPKILRNAWLQPEQETLRLAMNELMSVSRAEDVAACLLPHVISMVGGRGAALVSASGQVAGAQGQTPGLGDLTAGETGGSGVELPDLVRLPLSTGSLLVWTSPYAPVFGRQELDLLQAAGNLAELALQRIRNAERDSALAAVVDASADAIVSTALDGTIGSWNAGAEVIYGRPADEVVGKPLSQVVSPNGSGDVADLLQRVGDGDLVRLETQHTRRDGRPISVALTAAPLRNRAGEVAGASLIARDISARIQAQEALRASEVQFRGLMESAPDAMVIVDADGRITLVNRQTEQLFGYERGELLGEQVEILVTERLRDRHREHRSGYLATAGARPMGAGLQLYARRKDGGEFPVEISLGPLQTEGGTLVSAAVRDITDRKHAEEALEQAKLAAEQANQAKSEYLSRMSHELRTPLNAILGFAQLLELDELRDEQHESLSHILSAARHLLGLINEVLDIASIEAGRLTLSLEPVAVADVVAEVVSLIRPLADQRGILLGTPAQSCDQHILSDRQRLKQILLNLVSNAVKYNHEGGSVQVSCERVGGEHLRIKVTDTGPGIPAELFERLFVPFERLEHESSSVEGAGLGLPLSKRLAEAMGGTVDLTSAPQQGTTFWVELPLAEGPVQRAERQQHDASAQAGAEHAENVGPSLTVLYIEDNLSNLQLVERVLSRREGVKLISAMRPQLGLDLAREHHPDLVLLDLHLPDMPGQEVLRRLQASAATAGIPVVVLSADARPSLIEQLLDQGARSFLTKPLDVKELLGLLDEVAEEREPAG
jgi:PAS domain S-box-containing protein